MTDHILQRLAERGIKVSAAVITGLCFECDHDTAVIVKRLQTAQGENYGDYRNRLGSNGELVIIIIRNHEAKTAMFRRTNQPLTPESMRVSQVLDLTIG